MTKATYSARCHLIEKYILDAMNNIDQADHIIRQADYEDLLGISVEDYMEAIDAFIKSKEMLRNQLIKNFDSLALQRRILENSIPLNDER